MMKVKIRLVLHDWIQPRTNKSVYGEKPDLSMGSFHSGTTFNGEMELPGDDLVDLAIALRDGYSPVFYILDKQEDDKA